VGEEGRVMSTTLRQEDGPPLPEDTALLPVSLQVVNIGLESFAEDLRAQGAAVVQLDWRPPAGGDARMAALLAALDDED
jgi:FdrA protein